MDRQNDLRIVRSIMATTEIQNRLASGKLVVLDGGTGTELERRGVRMNADAWCGVATIDNLATLTEIHLDYIRAGADIITANTYASSRLMLEPAGYADRLHEINSNAIAAAKQAREESGRNDVLIAGSLSHMSPITVGTDAADTTRTLSKTRLMDAYSELASIIKEQGCDLVLLEMLYYPERIPLVIEAALATGLPVWAGFSARRNEKGELLSFARDRDIPFEEIVKLLDDYELDAAGIMHTPSNLVEDAISLLRQHHSGVLMAYPDSGYFKMPSWQFDEIIPPPEFLQYASGWLDSGVQVIGGCCGLSPEHIEVLQQLDS